MKDMIFGLVGTITTSATSTYPQDVATAVAAAAALVAVITIAWIVIGTTYLVVRFFTELARASAAVAGLITTTLITTVIIIGWLNR